MTKRPHINNDGEFQSDKYPTCPAGKVPLSVKDPTAQDLLWEYAQRRRAVDAEFADDLEHALTASGFLPTDANLIHDHSRCDGSCDIALARRQVGPDGIVPGSAKECAELWEQEASRLRAENRKLVERQQEHLQLIQTLSRADPQDGELDEAKRHRAALIAEVGTLRAEIAQMHLQCAACGRCAKCQAQGVILEHIGCAPQHATRTEPIIDELRMPAAFNLGRFYDDKAQWSLATFGPGDRYQGVIAHIRKELDEIEKEPSDLEEWVDVVLLAMDGAFRSAKAIGIDFVLVLQDKQRRNVARKWPDWRTLKPGEVSEHVRCICSGAPGDEDFTPASNCPEHGTR